LRLDIFFQPSQNKRAYDPMQTVDQIIISLDISFNNVFHGIREPIRKVFSVPEDMRHQEVKERP
jgi:hypothetical protein